MDLRKIASRVASHHESGDPSQPGGYDLSVTVKEVKLSVNGTVSGQYVSGELTLYGEPGKWTGHDYEPDEGTFDISEDPEGVQQLVLESAAEEAGG